MPLSTGLLRISSIFAFFKWLIKAIVPEGETDDCGLKRSEMFFSQAARSAPYVLKDQYVHFPAK